MTDDFTTDNMLIKATERFVCGKTLGGWYAAYCACPDCIPTNPVFLTGLFGSIPIEEQPK